MNAVRSIPTVVEHDGILVVRDDMYPGGTKARFLVPMLRDLPEKEFIYASPAQGGAQTALATAAMLCGKKATIFVAKRNELHPRAKMVRKLKGKVIQVPHGYLNVVQAAAKAYAAKRKDRCLLPFGMDSQLAVDSICEAALSLNLKPDEVWCAAGSGTLARGLARAWPKARLRVVQVGRELSKTDVGGKAKIFVYHRGYDKHAATQPPFPSDQHYDAKAWELCAAKRGKGVVLFWNVTGQP